MKELFKAIKRKVVRMLNGIGWMRQYKTLTTEPKKENFILDDEWYKGLKILMMVPHADDELISSYSILSRADNVTVYYCGFTGSNHAAENRFVRRGEILKLCSELKVKVIEGNGLCDNLDLVLANGNYDAILVPSLVDWHEEHRKISYMIKKACGLHNLNPLIYSYSVTVPNESRRKVLCVPLTEKQLYEKYELFWHVYVSQRIMPVLRLKQNERINGYHVGSYAAETFEMYEYRKWKKVVLMVEQQEYEENSKLRKQAQALGKTLNNLIQVRKTSKEYYKLIDKGN